MDSSKLVVAGAWQGLGSAVVNACCELDYRAVATSLSIDSLDASPPATFFTSMAGKAPATNQRQQPLQEREVTRNILHIDCSPRAGSHSRHLSAAIVGMLLELAPGAVVNRRDLGADPLPHAAEDYAVTLSSPKMLASPLEGSLDLSEILIAEVEAAEAIVIGTPMHNLTVPSVLKAWIDQIMRAGRTFRSTSAGKVGMIEDRPVFVAIASGGTYTGDGASQPDFLTTYLTAVLGSMGLNSLQFLSVQATAFLEGERAVAARAKALEGIDLSMISNPRRVAASQGA